MKPQCLHLKKHTANTKLGTGTCKKSQRKRKKATGQLFFLRLLRGTLLFLLMLNDLRSKGNNLKSSLSVSAVPAKELSEGWVGGGWETHAQNGEALFAAKERRKKKFFAEGSSATKQNLPSPPKRHRVPVVHPSRSSRPAQNRRQRCSPAHHDEETRTTATWFERTRAATTSCSLAD